MCPGYMHRAPVSMSTPLHNLTFPGCVTLGKSLPLSEPRVPLLAVKIASLLSAGRGAFLLPLRQCGRSSEMWVQSTSGPLHALFCLPGSPFPKGVPAPWPALPSCSCISVTLTTAAGLVTLLACPCPQGQLHFGPSCSLLGPLHS